MRIRLLIACAMTALIPMAARAQFYAYPSFQVPRVSLREYNFSVGDGPDAGTSLVFQWREGISDRMHLQLDAGFADPSPGGGDARFVIGGSAARQLTATSDEFPLDMLLTLGVGGSFGGGKSFLRAPVGLSVGHRFTFDVPLAVTPYAHARLSLDYCSRCAPAGRGDTNLGVDVDLGVEVEVTRSIALRASALLAGSDFFSRDNGFGVSLAWRPKQLDR